MDTLHDCPIGNGLWFHALCPEQAVLVGELLQNGNRFGNRSNHDPGGWDAPASMVLKRPVSVFLTEKYYVPYNYA